MEAVKEKEVSSEALTIEELQQRGNGGSLVQTREAKIELNPDSDELYFSFSSEEPVERYFG